MTYTKNIPLTGESLGSTRDRIAENFSEIYDVVDVNHVAFDESGSGKHKFMQMPEQASAPETAANESALYTKVSSDSEATLFYRAESFGSEYQLTRTIAAQIAKFATNDAYGTPPTDYIQTGGWTFLPGGLLFQYGFFGKPGNTASVGQIPFVIPFTTACFNVTAILYHTSSSGNTLIIDSNTPPTTTTFNYRTPTSSADGIFWSAIGI